MRLLSTLGTFAIAFSLAIAVSWAYYGNAAVQTGWRRNEGEGVFNLTLTPRPRQKPLVVWLGDSTLWPPPVSYTSHVARATKGKAKHSVIAFPGLDFFDYYAMLGKILEEPPEVVVMLANLRCFQRSRDDAMFRLLSALIPANELHRAMLLSLDSRDLTIARLLLNRVLRYGRARMVFYFYEGLRVLFQESDTWKELTPETRPARTPPRPPVPSLVELYSPSLDPRHPVVRAMEAAVRLAARHGTRVIVVAIPIPYDILESLPGYSPEAEAARVRVLGEAVQRSGGVFLDIHRALPRDEFRDDGGHYKEAGSRRIAQLILPILERELGSEKTRPGVGE